MGCGSRRGGGKSLPGRWKGSLGSKITRETTKEITRETTREATRETTREITREITRAHNNGPVPEACSR